MKGKKQKEPVGFNPAEIFAALALLEKERGIPQSFMMEKIVQALTRPWCPPTSGTTRMWRTSSWMWTRHTRT